MADENIGGVNIGVRADLSDLQADFAKAASTAQQAGEQMANAFTSGAGSSLEHFGQGIAEWIEHPLASAQGAIKSFVEEFGGIGVVAIAAAAGISEAAHAIIDLVLEEGAAAEATGNLADRLNLTFEDTKKLSEMAQIAGISVDGLQRVSMRLADALQDPEGAGKKVAKALEGMGIAASDSGEALLKLLERLAEIPDATERISKAHEVMGRGAVQLEPLLRNYTELSNAIDSLGGKLDGEMVANLKKADDAADKLAITWTHLKEGLAATFAPAITAAIDALTGLLTGPPQGNLDAQLARLSLEINQLEHDANSASSAFERWFQTQLGLKPNDAILEQKKMLLDTMDSQREAIARSKEYNEELDKSNAAQQKGARETKAAYEEMQKAETAFHNSEVEFYNSFPETYDAYLGKLSEGGKTAEESFKHAEAALEKAQSLAGSLSGKPAADLQEWITWLTKARDTAKQFADSDAFYKAAQGIQALTDKFPQQAAEIAKLDPAMKGFFDDMAAGAAKVPEALAKFNVVAETAKMLEGQKKLDDALETTSRNMEKMWDKYVEGANKAAAKQSTIDLAAEFKLLPPAIQEAITASNNFEAAQKILGITARDNGQAMSQSFLAFERAAGDNHETLDLLEQDWARISGQVSKVSHTDLPLAIRLTDEFVQNLVRLGGTQGQIIQAEEQELSLIIKSKEERGADATAEIIALERRKQEMANLIDASTRLGDVYVELRKTFNDAFTALEKGLASAIISGQNLGQVFINVGKQIATSILDTIIKGALSPLQDELNKTGGLFDVLSQKITGAVGNLGNFKSASASIPGLPGAGGGAPPVQMPGGSELPPTAGGVSQASGGGGAGGAASSLTNVVGAVAGVASAISNIIANFQFSHMNKLLGEIEVSTRGSLNEALNLRSDLWQQQDNLFHKLDDMWNEIRNVVDILRLMGGIGTGGGGGGSEDLSQKIADVINSRPATSGEGGSFVYPSAGPPITFTVENQAANESYAQSISSLANAASDAAGKLQGAVPPLEAMTRAASDFSSPKSPSGAISFGGGPVLGSAIASALEATRTLNQSPVSPPGQFLSLSGPSGLTRLGGDVARGATVYVTAVDPAARGVTKGIVKGLEEVGIRTR